MESFKFDCKFYGIEGVPLKRYIRLGYHMKDEVLNEWDDELSLIHMFLPEEIDYGTFVNRIKENEKFEIYVEETNEIRNEKKVYLCKILEFVVTDFLFWTNCNVMIQNKENINNEENDKVQSS